MIDIVFFDVDGVLTDGMVYVDSDGKESVRYFFNDVPYASANLIVNF